MSDAPEGCEDDFHDELCDCNQTRPHLSRAQPAPEEEDETANVDWERVYHPELYATPPAAHKEEG